MEDYEAIPVFLLSLFLFLSGCGVSNSGARTVPSGDKGSENYFCSTPDTPPSIGRVYSDRGPNAWLTISRNNWKIGIVEKGPVAHDKIERLVLFFHGGPRLPLASGRRMEDIVSLYEDGRTRIAFVAYSATESDWFDGSERLRAYGLKSLECDTLLVKDYISWVQEDAIEDIDIVVVGESFGSVATLRLATELGVEADGVVLTSPWLFPLSIDDLVSRNITYLSHGPPIPPNKRHLMEEDARKLYSEYFQISENQDGSSDGDKYLDTVLKNACDRVRSKSLVFVPEHEDRADFAKTMAYFDCFSGLNLTTVVDHSFHGMEYSFPAVRRSMLEFTQ